MFDERDSLVPLFPDSPKRLRYALCNIKSPRTISRRSTCLRDHERVCFVVPANDAMKLNISIFAVCDS